jgi:hypothetical protein
MSTEIPKAVWEGTFTVFGVELKCYILDNGQRIIDTECMDKLLKVMNDPDVNAEPGDIDEFTKWQQSGTKETTTDDESI